MVWLVSPVVALAEQLGQDPGGQVVRPIPFLLHAVVGFQLLYEGFRCREGDWPSDELFVEWGLGGEEGTEVGVVQGCQEDDEGEGEGDPRGLTRISHQTSTATTKPGEKTGLSSN